MIQRNITQKLFTTLILISNIIAPENLQRNLYTQINPEILKTIDLENHTDQDKTLLTACKLLEEFGSKATPISKVIWEAITSVEMITEILPRHHQTFTTFGYLALMQQCAQMTNDLKKLQTKKDLIEFFDMYQDTFAKLNTIIKLSAPAEQKYLTLCIAKNEEEIEAAKKIDEKLYFNMTGFKGLNENSWALGFGPRLNQLHTLAWYAIPALAASNAHKNYHATKKLEAQVHELATKQNELNPLETTQSQLSKNPDAQTAEQKNLSEKITALKKEINLLEQAIKNDPLLPQKASNAIQPKEITLDALDALKQEIIDTLPKAKQYSREHSIIYWNNFTGKYEEIDRYEKEIKYIESLLAQKSSLETKGIEQAYTALLHNYIDLKEKSLSLSNAQQFVKKITFGLPEEQRLIATYHAKSYIQAFIKQAALDGMLNLPNLLYDGIIHIPDIISKVSEEVKNLYTDFTKSLIRGGYKNGETSTKITAGLATTVICAYITAGVSIYPHLLYIRYHSTKELFDLIYERQKDLVGLGYLIKSMQKVNNIIQKDHALKVLIPESAKLSALFDSKSKKTSLDLKNLVNTLLSSSFQDGSAYYFSQQGKILATHHLFMRIKEQLVPYLQAYGHIDAYLSTYKLYSQYKDHPNARICLPTFVESEDPQVIAKNFWHPLINANKVVTNSLSLGDCPENANLIITGPNAGGKTTSLMALIINIIMAQAFGIAPASSLSITPFTKIHSYLDITTNLLEGESLFKAEANRSKRLKESILSCKPGEKTFTIIDEIFSGTNPDVASKVGFTFADQIGNIDHSMAIITTHFPRLTELEETGNYQNYKVADAHIAQDGTITYPFKLERGKSTQNIAEHMLTQEGII